MGGDQRGLDVIRHDSPLGRWQLTSLRPEGPLGSVVRSLWEVEGTTTYAAERMFPRATVEVLFNLGPSHRLLDPRGPAFGTEFRRAWVAGLQEECLTIEAPAQTRILGIRLRPLGARMFFGIPLQELACRVVDLDLVLGSEIETVRQALLDAASPVERFGIVARLLERRLAGASAVDPVIAALLDAMNRTSGAAPMRLLSRSLGVSEDKLTRTFRREVGLTPKRYARMLRFHGVISRLDGSGRVSWTRLAADLGYFDQSHFIKDFRSFTGTTPSDYLQRRSPEGDALVEA